MREDVHKALRLNSRVSVGIKIDEINFRIMHHLCINVSTNWQCLPFKKVSFLDPNFDVGAEYAI